ncbi:MAG: alpha/beta fold hydrolase [Chloroflexi bacterium]|nr:alpha/beta fold hydrolase [Chloroflexota bacterium]MQC26161.1 alpha/beta fold hydrolase [Chloroflexota bacterium]
MVSGRTGILSILISFCLVAAAGCSTAPVAETSTPTPAPTASPTPEEELFDYEIIDPVEFQSGDLTLVGRIYMPISDGPVPGVVMVHGSGRRTRDESLRLAKLLVEAGFAVLRYDKRGAGDSDGIYSDLLPGNSEALLNRLADDVIAAVEFLGQQENIDAERIGLFGNSQAGWIMPLAAARSDQIHFAVLLVSPAVSVGEENFYSAKTFENPERLTDELLDEISADLLEYSGRRGFDPRESIEAMNIPALWVLGGWDASIPTRETVAILEEIKQEFDKPFVIHVYPLGTHSLMNFETMEQIDFMSEVVLDWLAEIDGN